MYDLFIKSYNEYAKNIKEIDFHKIIRSNEMIAENPYFHYEAAQWFLRKNNKTYDCHCLIKAISWKYLQAIYLLNANSRNIDVKGLLEAAKDGDERTQVLIGLIYIYGINHEVNKSAGVFWLETAAYQDEIVACIILASIYFFGYQNITKDDIKYQKYVTRSQELSKDLKILKIEPFIRMTIKDILNTKGDDLLYFSPEIILD